LRRILVAGANRSYLHRFIHSFSRAHACTHTNIRLQGAYHTGVEIDGREYSFSERGISAGVPKTCPEGVTHAKAILMGRTTKSVSGKVAFLRPSFAPGSYDLLTKNCNNFSDALCFELLGKRIPQWINRLARAGNAIDSGKPPSPPGTTESNNFAVDSTTPQKLSSDRKKITDTQRRLMSKLKLEGGKKSMRASRRKNRV